MINTLKSEAQRLERLKEEGWKVEGQVADDQGALMPPDLEALITQAMQNEPGGQRSACFTRVLISVAGLQQPCSM